MLLVFDEKIWTQLGSFYRNRQSPPAILGLYASASQPIAAGGLDKRDQGHLEATELFCVDATAATITS